jgi:DTW domain-containing protein YfiP
MTPCSGQGNISHSLGSGFPPVGFVELSLSPQPERDVQTVPRSVVLAGAARCSNCCLPPRWCVCDALPAVAAIVPVHVLIHRQEQHKPTSTGRLIARTVEGSRCHVYQRDSRFFSASSLAAADLLPERELWVLHPLGEPMPSAASLAGRPLPQLLLLDGTWRQAGEMLRTVEGMGRCVRLPSPGPSRYWLRGHDAPMHVSTAEALLGVFGAVGDTAAEHGFRLHFELHVYAALLARGRRELADRYLEDSPLRDAMPEFLEELNTRRLPSALAAEPRAGGRGHD